MEDLERFSWSLRAALESPAVDEAARANPSGQPDSLKPYSPRVAHPPACDHVLGHEARVDANRIGNEAPTTRTAAPREGRRRDRWPGQTAEALSVTSCSNSRRRPPPSADRTAGSRARPDPTRFVTRSFTALPRPTRPGERFAPRGCVLSSFPGSVDFDQRRPVALRKASAALQAHRAHAPPPVPPRLEVFPCGQRCRALGHFPSPSFGCLLRQAGTARRP